MGHLQCTVLGVSLIVVLMCVKNSSAIECYECNSYTDKRCIGDEKNKLSDDMKVKCPATAQEGQPFKLCRKIKQVIDFEVNGLQPESRIIRTCGWDDSTYKNKCYQRSGFGGRQEVCACEKDFCNGSTTITASSISILLVGSVSLVLATLLQKIDLL